MARSRRAATGAGIDRAAAVSLCRGQPAQMDPGQRTRAIRKNRPCALLQGLAPCLSDVPATDPTEASSSFTNVRTQQYSADVLDLYGLASIGRALPQIVSSTAIAGHVTSQAAAQTGLKEGTPVACGLHDVTSSAVGMGNTEPGILSITAGTFSINEILSDRPQLDPRWSCRNGTRPGQWMNMSISPAS